MKNDELETPNYYQGTDNKDLLSRFSDGMISEEEFIGFCKGNIIKYVIRHQNKNGVEDLQKAMTYLQRLYAFEAKKEFVGIGMAGEDKENED